MDNWWFKFTLLMTMTIGITWVIVWTRNWIIRNKAQHPELFKSRHFLAALLYLVLQTPDL